MSARSRDSEHPICNSSEPDHVHVEQLPPIADTGLPGLSPRSAVLQPASDQFAGISLAQRVGLIDARLDYLSWYIRQIHNRIVLSLQAEDTAAFYFWYEVLTSCVGGVLLSRDGLRQIIRTLEVKDNSDTETSEWSTWAQAICSEIGILLDDFSRFRAEVNMASQHKSEQEFLSVYRSIKTRTKDDYFAVLGPDCRPGYHSDGIHTATAVRMLHQMRTIARTRMLLLAPDYDFADVMESLWDEVEDVNHSAFCRMLQQTGDALGVLLIERRHQPLKEHPNIVYV